MLRGARQSLGRPPLVRLSAFYAAYFGALGIMVPYWPLYLEQRGHGPLALGSLMAIIPATKITTPAFWGWVSARTGEVLPLIRLCSFLALLSLAGLPWLPPSLATDALILLAFGFFWNGSLPLVETLTLAHLRGRGGYGRVRLWGSMGFAVTVGVGGVLLGQVVPVEGLPALMGVLLAAQWIVTLSLPQAGISAHALPPGWSLRRLIRLPVIWSFFLAALLLQVAHGPYYAFYSVWLKGSGYPDGVIGELWALAILAEVVLFAFIDGLERRFGARTLFLWGLIASILRWPLIGWAPDSLLLLGFAQVLHAGSFGLMHVTSIAWVHRYFTGRQHAMGQSLLSALVYGLGGALGSFSSGMLWGVMPAAWVFCVSSGVSLMALFIAWRWMGGEMDPAPAEEG